MRVGELERSSGCSRHTIRFYESEGLIDAPRRDVNNYRSYASEVVEELAFIRSAQNAGFTLAEIRSILESKRSSTIDCVQGAELVDNKIAEIGLRVAQLKRTKSRLEAMRRELVCSAFEHSLEVPEQLRKYGLSG
ncbi:MAG: MerR family transcriptional regulator [Aeromicrobium sp.]